MNNQFTYALNFFLEKLEAAGLDKDTLRHFHFGAATEGDTEQRPLSTYRLARILAYSARQTGDPDVALKLVESIDLRDYGVLGYALSSAPGIREFLEVLSGYVTLSQRGMNVDYQIDQGTLTLKATVTDWRVPVDRLVNDWAASTGLAFMEAWAGQPCPPLRIYFTHSEPEDTRYYVERFHCPIHFASDRNTISFRTGDLCKPRPHADTRLFRLLQTELNTMLERAEAESADPPFIDSVQQAIACQLQAGDMNAETVASALGIGRRKLQRRLEDNGYTFTILCELTREHLSRVYLAESDLPLASVAHQAGYSDLSSFIRAFRNWTGETPEKFRKITRKAGAHNKSPSGP